jgi:hypothetical protein
MDRDQLCSFDGRGAETTWRELAIEPTDDQMGPPDLVKNTPDR